MHKKLIISHIADIDGLGSVVLSKIIFKNIDYILVELPDLQKTIKDLIDTNKYKEYEEIFITDLSNFTDVNEVYGSFFTENYPARSCVEVSKLPKGVGIEIEAIALRK